MQISKTQFPLPKIRNSNGFQLTRAVAIGAGAGVLGAAVSGYYFYSNSPQGPNQNPANARIQDQTVLKVAFISFGLGLVSGLVIKF